MPVVLACHPPGTLLRLRSRPLPHGTGSRWDSALRRMHEAAPPRGLRRVRESRSPARSTSRREGPVPVVRSAAPIPGLCGLRAHRAPPARTGNHLRAAVRLVLECPTVRPLRRLRPASSTGRTPRRRIRLLWAMLASANAPAVCPVRRPNPQAEPVSGPDHVSAMLPRASGTRVHPVRSTSPLRDRAARGFGVSEMLAVAALGRPDATVAPGPIHGGPRPAPMRPVRPSQVDQNPTPRRGRVPSLRRPAAGGVRAVRVPSADHPGSRSTHVPTMFLNGDPDLPHVCRGRVRHQPRHDEGPMPELSPSTGDRPRAGRRGRGPASSSGAFREPARGLRRPCAGPPVAPAWPRGGGPEGHGSRTAADRAREPR